MMMVMAMTMVMAMAMVMYGNRCWMIMMTMVMY